MKFSVLIPVYNVSDYLPECLNSVLMQTYRDFEIIITDDGSTDDSGLICDKFASLYPEKIRVIHQRNEGLISARRSGINAAKGEYVIFVDSDDYIAPGLLDTVNSYLDNDTDMAIYSFRYLLNGKTEERKCELFPDGTLFSSENKEILYKRFLDTYDVTAIWIKAIKTSILCNDPTDYSLFYGKNMAEDVLQSIYPLTAAKKIVFINKPLYYYRIIKNSISHSFTTDTITAKSSVHVYEALLNILPEWGLCSDEQKEKLYAKWFNNTLFTFKNYYENAQDRNERIQILSFDWNIMLPEGSINAYCNEFFINIYNCLKSNNYLKLRYLFAKNRIIQMKKNKLSGK